MLWVWRSELLGWLQLTDATGGFVWGGGGGAGGGLLGVWEVSYPSIMFSVAEFNCKGTGLEAVHKAQLTISVNVLCI